MASPLKRCGSLLFSALGQLPPLYEAAPDHRVITQYARHPLLKKKKIRLSDLRSIVWHAKSLAGLKIVTCAVCPKAPKTDALTAGLLHMSHRERHVSVNIPNIHPPGYFNCTPCTDCFIKEILIHKGDLNSEEQCPNVLFFTSLCKHHVKQCAVLPSSSWWMKS